MPFLTQTSLLVLLETSLRIFAGHTNVEALTYTVILWVLIPKLRAFGENFAREFYDVESVIDESVIVVLSIKLRNPAQQMMCKRRNE